MKYLKELNQQKQSAEQELEKPFRDIMYGKNPEEYKKNDRWDITKISATIQLSPQTVRKWIKRIESSS